MNNLRPRVIPSFYTSSSKLINRIYFNDKKERYIGDPLNTLRIFNQYNPDEIILIDIDAWINGINYELLESISDEIFCPLTYGGGVYNYDDAKNIIQLGFEKISFNFNVINNFNVIEKVSYNFGSQSTIINFDLVYEDNEYYIFDYREKKKTNYKFFKYLSNLDYNKIGEILISMVSLDGSFEGPDLKLIKKLTDVCNKPIIYKGGMSNYNDFKDCFDNGCSAVTSSNFFIMKKKFGGIVFSNPNKCRI